MVKEWLGRLMHESGLEKPEIEKVLKGVESRNLGEVRLDDLIALEADYGGLEVLRYFLYLLSNTLLEMGREGVEVLILALRDLYRRGYAMSIAVEWYASILREKEGIDVDLS